jgi:hypothetical protein
MPKPLSPAEQEALEFQRLITENNINPTTETEPKEKVVKAKAPRKVTRAAKIAATPAPAKKAKAKKAVPAEEGVEEAPATPVEVAETPEAAEPVEEAPATPVEPSLPEAPQPAPPEFRQSAGIPALLPDIPAPPAALPAYFGPRHNRQALRNMHGVFLTALDAGGKILMFVAGALRARATEEHDEVFFLGTEDIFTALAGVRVENGVASQGAAYYPEVRRTLIPSRSRPWRLDTYDADAGEDSRRAILREIPRLSSSLRAAIPEFSAWGLFQAYPNPMKPALHGRVNGTNHEFWLDQNTWRETDHRPTGSSTASLEERMAPGAAALAARMGWCWALAATAATLYGGMNKLPSMPGAPGHAGLDALIARERAQALRRRGETPHTTVFGSDVGAILDAAMASPAQGPLGPTI